MSATNRSVIENYDAAIVAQECELLALKDAVWKFLDKEHRLAETKVFQKNVRAADSQVGALLTKLLNDEKLSEFKAEAAELCKRTRELSSYPQEISKALADDYADLKCESDDKKKALLGEVGALLTIPGFLFGLVKGGFGHDAITPQQAVEAGFAVSVPIFFRKQIPGAFKAAGRAACNVPKAAKDLTQSVCDIPKEIKNSFMLYYLKESLRESIKRVGRNTEKSPPRP